MCLGIRSQISLASERLWHKTSWTATVKVSDLGFLCTITVITTAIRTSVTIITIDIIFHCCNYCSFISFFYLSIDDL